MHRHGYKGRKFGRERDQRAALIKSLAESLILRESIETTLEKAKDLRPYVEKLVTKAVTGGLHNRRQVISSLQTLEAAHKLIDSIGPKMKRTSGYLRIVKTTARRGDNAQMARISFVDSLSDEKTTETPKVKKVTTTKTVSKTPKKAPIAKGKK